MTLRSECQVPHWEEIDGIVCTREKPLNGCKYPASMTPGDIALLPWRTGRKIGKNIYAMVGDKPSDDDIDIGRFDNELVAATAVLHHNNALAEIGIGRQFADLMRERAEAAYEDEVGK